MDSEISHFKYNSKHYDKCKFTLKMFSLLSVSNLFSLYKKLYKKCQRCMRVYVSKGITMFSTAERFSWEGITQI